MNKGKIFVLVAATLAGLILVGASGAAAATDETERHEPRGKYSKFFGKYEFLLQRIGITIESGEEGSSKFDVHITGDVASGSEFPPVSAAPAGTEPYGPYDVGVEPAFETSEDGFVVDRAAGELRDECRLEGVLRRMAERMAYGNGDPEAACRFFEDAPPEAVRWLTSKEPEMEKRMRDDRHHEGGKAYPHRCHPEPKDAYPEDGREGPWADPERARDPRRPCFGEWKPQPCPMIGPPFPPHEAERDHVPVTGNAPTQVPATVVVEEKAATSHEDVPVYDPGAKHEDHEKVVVDENATQGADAAKSETNNPSKEPAGPTYAPAWGGSEQGNRSAEDEEKRKMYAEEFRKHRDEAMETQRAEAYAEYGNHSAEGNESY